MSEVAPASVTTAAPAAPPASPEGARPPLREQIGTMVNKLPTNEQRGGALMHLSRQAIGNAQRQGQFAEGPLAPLTVAPEGGKSVLDTAAIGGRVREIPGADGAEPTQLTAEEWQKKLDAAGPAGSPERTALESQGSWQLTKDTYTSATREQPLVERQAQSKILEARVKILEELARPTPEIPAAEGIEAVAAKPGDANAEAVLSVLDEHIVVEIVTEEGKPGEMVSRAVWEARLAAASPEERAQLEQKGIWKFKDEEAPQEAPKAQEKKETTSQGVIERERDAAVKKVSDLQEQLKKAKGEEAKTLKEQIKQARTNLQALAVAAEAQGDFGGLLRRQVMTQLQESGAINISLEDATLIMADAPDMERGTALLIDQLNRNGASGAVIGKVTEALNPKSDHTLMEALTDPEVQSDLVPLIFTKSTNADILTNTRKEVAALMDPRNLERWKKLPGQIKGGLLAILLMLGINATEMIIQESGVR